MTAIISGNYLGLLNSSLSTLGAGGVLGQAAQGRAAEQVYVNAATGNLIVQNRDEVLLGRGPDLNLLRTYNSQGLLDGDNNDNWRLGVYRKVYSLTGTANTAGSTVARVDGEGAETLYAYDAAINKYINRDGGGAFDTLTYDSASQIWTWTDGDSRITEHYDAVNGGRITRIQDADGNSLTYTYNAAGFITQVQDASGESTYLDYTGANLSQLRTVTGNGQTLVRTRYDYDAANRLIQVITDLSPEDASIADGKRYTVTYTYDGASNRVATMTQSDSSSLAFTYIQVGADWRIAGLTDALGRVTAFAYDTAARTTTVTDALGLVTVFAYDNAGRLTGVTGPAAGGVVQVASYAYDDSGNVTGVTDALGNVVVYEYDANGNRVRERDAAGNTLTRVFDDNNALRAQTTYLVPDPDGAGVGQAASPLTVRHVYDGANRLRFVVSAQGEVMEYRYNGFGQRVAAIQYTAARYDVAALAPSATLTEADLVAWLPADRSASMRSDTTYDFRGQIASTTTYEAVNAAGQGIVDGTEAVTQYVYDQAGNLLKTVDPRGGATPLDPNDFSTTYLYDGLGRLLSTTDALGHTTLTQYDDANRKTVLTLANGLITTSTYDAAGGLISVLQSANTLVLGETKYFYDVAGRLRRTQDPTGVNIHILYDEGGRKIATIDGFGALTEYRYNANGDVTHTIAYATGISTGTLAVLFDAATGVPTGATLAAIRPPASANDRLTWNAYDSANRLVKSVDAMGFVTQHVYDGAGRVTDSVQFATAIDTTVLSDTPQPTDIDPASSPDDRLTRHFHDADGKLRGILDGEGYLVAYEYDAAGRLVETIGYATATPAALRASGTLAQLIPTTGDSDIHSYTLYNARGQIAAAVDAEGYLTENVYDLAGNKTQAIRYATPVVYTTGAGLAALRPAPTSQDQAISSTYTALNRLASESGVDGTLTQYTYDEAGNLTKTVKAADTAGARTLMVQYDKQGRLTAALSGNGAALLTGDQTQAEIDALWAAYGVRHTYDAAGRRTSTTDANGAKTIFFYNEDGALTHTVNALGEVQESVYDTFGQRVQITQYGTRLSAATLASLSGGLVNSALTAALAGIYDPTLDSTTRFAYTATGKLQQTIDALGNSVSQSYNAFGERVGQSQALNAGETLDHGYRYDRRGLLTQTVWDPSGLHIASTTDYDAFGRATHTTDANGNLRTQSYDKRGRVVTTTDPLNHTRTVSYDAFDRVLAQTDALGQTTTYQYDTANRSVTVTTPEGVVTTKVSNRHGETLSVIDGRGNTITYAYDKNGNLITVTDALGNTTTSSYDNAGLQTESVDANGTKTTFTYDAANRLFTRSVDPTGLNLTTRYEYDAKGQTVKVTDANGVVTQTQFDLKGQVTQVAVDPAGLNLKTAYTYDARGKTLTMTEGAGSAQPRVTQYTYDKLGRRLSERLDPSGIDVTTTYAYDKNNNVIRKTDALGNITRFAYDANDRLIYTVDALGGVRKNEYDAQGRVIRLTAYATPISLTGLTDTTTPADIAARIAVSSSDQTKGYVYNADGRELYCIDAVGGVTQKSYDANGNLIRRLEYTNPIATGIALTQAAIAGAIAPNVNDRATRTVYDAANRATFTLDAAGFVTHTAYDNNGNVTKEVRYANALQGSFTDNIAPQIVASAPASGSYIIIDPAKDRVTRSAYDAADRMRYSVDAEGYVTERRFDALSREIRRIRYNDKVIVADGASAASLAALLPAVPPASAVQEETRYDNAGRVFETVDGEGAVTRNLYDALGRKTDTIRAFGTTAAGTTHNVYDAAGRLLEQTGAYGTAEASTQRFRYDLFGNDIAYIDPRGVDLAERDTEWALAERLHLGYTLTDINGIRAKRASELTAAEQTSLRALYTTTQVFDSLNRKRSATDPLGNITQTVYDMFGNIVKAIDPKGNAGYFYYDALNRITFQIDPEGYATQTQYDAFGNAKETTKYANKVQGSYSETLRPQVLAAVPTGTPPAAYLVTDTARDQHTLADYDSLNHVSRITDAENHVETFTYDAQGNVLTHRDKNSSLFSYEYNARGDKTAEFLPITSANGFGQQVQVINRCEYDAAGNKTRYIEAQGLPEERITQYRYDKNDRLVETIDPQMMVGNSVLGVTGALAVTTGNVNYQIQVAAAPVSATQWRTQSQLTMSWSPIIGYGSGNLRIERVVTISGTVTIGTEGTSTRVFSLASGSTSFTDIAGATGLGPLGIATNSVRLYKETASGDILIGEWIPPTGFTNASASTPIKSILHFSGQPAAGHTLRIAYWPSADPNNITELDLASYEVGTFSGMAPGVLAGDFGYQAKVFDAQGQVLNQVSGTFSIAGTASTTIQAVPLLSSQLQTPHTFKTYDARGNLVTETDAKGNSTYHYYDANNRKTATVDAERYLRRYFYDAAGNVIGERTYADRIPDAVALTALPDPATIAGMNATNYRETRYRYDADQRVIEAKTQEVLLYDRTNGLRTAALVSQRQYDQNGNLVLAIDANGNQTFSFYDKRGKKIVEVDALGYLTARQYDANGNVIREAKYATALSTATRSALAVTSDPSALETEVASAANPDNRITVYSYDRMNRKTAETLLGLTYSEFASATNGQLNDRTADVATRYEYDFESHATAITVDTARTDYIYDALGRKLSEQNPIFTDYTGATVRSRTDTVYNGVGKIISITRRGATATDVQVTRYEYDPFGHRTKETDPLNSPITYFYDLNGSITVKHERRTNPDGTQPAIDTVYTYDKLNRQVTTKDVQNFIYSATYNAFGEIVRKGLNNLDKEFYDYDNAGRLIKTNKDDGIYRGYLYDANGNETAKIQSGIQDTDLSSLTINQIATLEPTVIQRTESEYDATNQLIRTYQASTQSTTDNVGIQHVWVDALNDPFTGGTLTPMAPGVVNYQIQVAAGPVSATQWRTQSKLTMSWPPIIGYGSGNLRIERVVTISGTVTIGTEGTSTRVFSLASGSTSFTDIAGATGLGPLGIATNSVRLYKETPFGSILINEWIPPNGTVHASTSKSLPGLLHFTGQRTEASTLQLWIWPTGGTKPATPVSVPKLVTASGATVNGWFVFDWSSFAAGNYEYEFETRDTAGKALDRVRGTLTLGSNPTVNSKQLDTIQPVLTPGSTSNNMIAHAQSYNAFGEVTSEIDGRAQALTTSNEAWAQAERQRLGFATLVSGLTDADKQRLRDIYTTSFVYDKRGQLVKKTDPETSSTADTGAISRVRPTTQYYYDVLGRNIGVRDPNQSLNPSAIINTQRYDAAGHLIAEYHPDGGGKRYGYDIYGNRRFQINELNARTDYTYDAKNQLKRIERPTDASFGNAARFELYDYDDAGRRIKHTDALGFSELTYYDDIGRVKKTVTNGGVVTDYRYIFDAASGGTTVITTQGDGRTLRDQKDYFGRLLHHEDLSGHSFDYTYNKAGSLTHQQSSTGQNIDFTYYQNGYLKDTVDNALNTKTRYEYDPNGNRIFEANYQGGSNVYYQWSRAQYDELNRVTAVNDPKYNVTYEYDANSNRRHIFARYHDGLQGSVQVQDYWYAYDGMNRFTVTKGILADTLGNPIDVNATPTARGTGRILAGSQGYAIGYDVASQRKTANNESYDYNAGGLLTTTHIDNLPRAQRVYDVTGNVKQYLEYNTAGTVTRNYQYSYTADHQVKTESDGSFTSTYSYDSAGNLASIVSLQPGGTTVTTTYAYEYWDTAKQKEIKVQASNQAAPGWAPGFSRFTFDVNGHLTQVSDMVANRHLSYKLDADGRILQRNELVGITSSRTQNYYYLNGVGIGDAGGFGSSKMDYASVLANRGQEDKTRKPVASADFDYNYQPVNDAYPAPTPGTFTVRQGDTLPSVALAVWGDSSLWYLIADANGLAANATLTAGQILVIPNVVTNIHNNSSTFKPYNPGELIGDTTPTLPDPPPPPVSDNCNIVAVIVVIVVVIVVTWVTKGALTEYVGEWAASVLAAAAGNAAGQVAATALELRDHFSWKEVGTAALTAGLTYGIDTGNVATTALLKEAVSQGVRIATNQQEKFDWAALAAAPINAAIDSEIAGTSNATSTSGATAEGFATDLAAGIAKGVVSQGMAILINRQDTIEWNNIAANALGNAIGNAMAADIPAVRDLRIKQMEAKRLAGRAAQPQLTAADYADLELGQDMRAYEQYRKIEAEVNKIYADPEIQKLMLKNATLNFAPSEKAYRDRVFAGGVNGSLEALFKPGDLVPNKAILPQAEAFIEIDGNKDGKALERYYQAVREIGVRADNARDAAAYLVFPGMSEQDIQQDISQRLGLGFQQTLSRPENQTLLAERVAGAKPGDLLNITDFWQAAVDETRVRAYRDPDAGMYRDLVDYGGSFPILSKILGGLTYQRLVAADPLAPDAYRDYQLRSLGVDVTTLVAPFALPVRSLGLVARGELSMAEARMGLPGLAETVTRINLTAPLSKGGTFEDLFYAATRTEKYDGPLLQGTTYGGQARNTLPDLVRGGESGFLPGITDLKNVIVQGMDTQLQAQLSLARAQGVPFNVVVSPYTQVYGSVVREAASTGGNVYVFNPLTKAFVPYR